MPARKQTIQHLDSLRYLVTRASNITRNCPIPLSSSNLCAGTLSSVAHPRIATPFRPYTFTLMHFVFSARLVTKNPCNVIPRLPSHASHTNPVYHLIPRYPARVYPFLDISLSSFSLCIATSAALSTSPPRRRLASLRRSIPLDHLLRRGAFCVRPLAIRTSLTASHPQDARDSRTPHRSRAASPSSLFSSLLLSTTRLLPLDCF